MTVKDVLEKLGYKLQSSNNFWRMSALYRKSNSNSLSVNKETGWFEDFVTGENGPLSNLVALTLGISREQGLKYLADSNANFKNSVTEEEISIKNEEVFNSDLLKDLLPSFAFYKNKGISEKTLREFNGGVKTCGKLNNRFVFPIFDENKKIVGVSGRDLLNNSETRPKWKILGKKNNFIFPAHLSGNEIELKSEVVLVESIGDALALYDAGIKNILVLFGTKVSKAIVLYLIRQNVNKIIIATNNDVDSSTNWGEEAAKNIYKQLLNFFDSSKIEIRLPAKNDFGTMSKEEILEWAGRPAAKSA